MRKIQRARELLRGWSPGCRLLRRGKSVESGHEGPRERGQRTRGSQGRRNVVVEVAEQESWKAGDDGGGWGRHSRVE